MNTGSYELLSLIVALTLIVTLFEAAASTESAGEAILDKFSPIY